MTLLTLDPKSSYPNISSLFNHLRTENQHTSMTEPFHTTNQQLPISSPEIRTLPSSTRIAIDILEAQQIWQREKRTSTFHIFEMQLCYLELLYSFRGKKEIVHFLEIHKFLVPLLIEAKANIINFFPESEVFLEIDIYPKAKEDCQLIAFIATSLSSREALNRLKQLDEMWWLNALDQAKGKFCMNVEFR